MAMKALIESRRFLTICGHIQAYSTSANVLSQRKEIDVYGAKMSFIDTGKANGYHQCYHIL